MQILRQHTCDLLDDDTYEVLLRFAADEKRGLVYVDELCYRQLVAHTVRPTRYNGMRDGASIGKKEERTMTLT